MHSECTKQIRGTAEESTKTYIRTKNIGNVKFVRRFRALSFPYAKVVISVVKKQHPSHRAKIGVNTPGINSSRR